MNATGPHPRRDNVLRQLKAMGGGSWMPWVALLGLLAVVLVGGYFALTMNSDIELPDTGAFAMTAGVLFALVVGVGLMALIFFSSRRGYDETPTVERRDEDRKP